MSAALSTQTTVGVIGAGVMGAGIAQVAAAAGHPVLLFDAMAGAAETGRARLAKGLSALVAKGKMTQEAVDSLIGRIALVDTLEGLAPAGLVIEAVVERLDVKRKIFGNLEAIVAEDAILASNTSSISITAIGAELKRPQNLVGMHFFNPAPVMKLVEVISGLATSADVAETIYATSVAWGKKPVHAKSTPGFIVNRMARPYYAEALRVVEENAATPQIVDLLLTKGAGFPMGPFKLMDLIGNDTNYAVTNSTFNAYYGDPRFRPSLLQGELVAAGRLGRKSGQGFYDYAQTEVPIAHQEVQPLASVLCVHGTEGPLSVLIDRIKAAGTEVNHSGGTGSIELIWGEARLCLTDGRPATLRAGEGRRDLAVLDLADDYATVSHLAFAVQDRADPQTAQDTLAVLAAAGIRGHQIDDIPGLVLARTFAMLANEAAEAVLAGVGSIEGIDTAMRFGVNYPRGPLEWADRLGAGLLVDILDGITQSYGDDRYRVSVKLRRIAQSKARFYPA